METTTQKPSQTDRIQKKTVLRAPRSRVWRAISDSKEFGAWFGLTVDGPFVPGAAFTAKSAQTKVDPEVAKSQKPYEGMPFEIIIDRVEPERLFSFKWHPFAVEKDVDYSSEPHTLVTFELEEAPGGTHLTITESGFDRVPLARRAQAFAMNEQGWAAQAKLIEKYLEQAS
jgi:uncharacterized protein YndB with AHSA1/START domain